MTGGPLPWEQMPATDERYITVDPQVFDLIRRLWVEELPRRPSIEAVQLLLRVVRVDPTSGRIVFAAKLVRDQGEGSGELPTSPAGQPRERPGHHGPGGAGRPHRQGGAPNG